MMARGGRENGAQRRNPSRITKQKSEVFDNQRLPIFFIAFLASFWRDKVNTIHPDLPLIDYNVFDTPLPKNFQHNF